MPRSISLCLRFTILALLLTVFLAVKVTFAINTHAVAPNQKSVQSISVVPLSLPKNAVIKVNSLAQIVFSPKTLSCYATLPCINITNTTGQTIGLYLNGGFLFNMPPGDVVGTTFAHSGTDIYTMPNTNAQAQLTVTVQPYTAPNADLKINKSGVIVFSPQKLTCPYYADECASITNTTAKQLRVYLDGTFSFTIYPNQVYNLSFGNSGKHILTIPETNSQTQLLIVAH